MCIEMDYYYFTKCKEFSKCYRGIASISLIFELQNPYLHLCMIYIHVSYMKGLVINKGTSVALQRDVIFQQQK